MRRAMLIVLIALCARGARGCMCSPSEFSREVRMTDAIFTATIVSKRVTVDHERRDEAVLLATARAGRVWKGNPTPLVRIRTGIGGGDCGTELALGETYVVFGYGSGGEFGTSSCSRTGTLLQSGQTVASLGDAKRDHGGEGASPAVWLQPFWNIASLARLLAAWERMFIERLAIAAVFAILILLIVAKRKVIVPLVAWLFSIAYFASLEVVLEFPVAVWIGAAVIFLLLGYFVSQRAVVLDSRAFLIVAPAVFSALLLALAWPRDGDFRFSLLELLLGGWLRPRAAMALSVAIAYLVLALLWHASTARRWLVAGPCALALALLALPVPGPWPLVLDALTS